MSGHHYNNPPFAADGVGSCGGKQFQKFAVEYVDMKTGDFSQIHIPAFTRMIKTREIQDKGNGQLGRGSTTVLHSTTLCQFQT